MINFVSTFPPIMCGIGTYTHYLVSKMPAKNWKVISFKLDEFLTTEEAFLYPGKVLYEINLSSPQLLPGLEGEVVWFQHTFGMWGRESPAFLKLVKEVKSRKKKVIATFHTIHFESEETKGGMERKEEDFLKEVLPWLDAATVFTDGAHWAIALAFPKYRDKVVVLRHGVHLYPKINPKEAKERLLGYLLNRAEISWEKKKELEKIYPLFFSEETILLGNFGFITRDKAPLSLYELGKLVQAKLPGHRVIVLYIGRIQKRKDKKMEEKLPILERLRLIHDGRSNLFFEDYLSEEIFPFAFSALDFSSFWCHNATQSGRMAHAQGTGTCVVGRRIEGIGETLDLAGLPSGVNLNDLAEKIVMLVSKPELKEGVRRRSWDYAQEFSFEKQAEKHLLLEEAVRAGKELPSLDRSKPNFAFILPNLALGDLNSSLRPPQEITAFLNVAEEVNLNSPPQNYLKIPLKDGISPPLESLKEAIKWIRRQLDSEKLLVFCRYGSGRSASVVIGYLCSLGLDYEEAIKLVAKKKPDINPLPGLGWVIQRVLEKEKFKRRESLVSLRGKAEAISVFPEIATNPSGSRNDRQYGAFSKK